MGVFSKKYDEVTEAVITEGCIYSYPQKDGKMLKAEVKAAMWDTGSTETLISKRIINQLQLKPVAKRDVESYLGHEIEDVYHVMVGIPTGDVVTDIYVTECRGDSYDAVIGMDIIGLGDFAFTNKDGKSCFSFRLPSKEHIELTD